MQVIHANASYTPFKEVFSPNDKQYWMQSKWWNCRLRALLAEFGTKSSFIKHVQGYENAIHLKADPASKTNGMLLVLNSIHFCISQYYLVWCSNHTRIDCNHALFPQMALSILLVWCSGKNCGSALRWNEWETRNTHSDIPIPYSLY